MVRGEKIISAILGVDISKNPDIKNFTSYLKTVELDRDNKEKQTRI